MVVVQLTCAVQFPQEAAVPVVTSQPLVPTMSQSSTVAGHIDTRQIPVTQSGAPEGAMQTLPHVLQWFASVASSTSQPLATLPSQFAYPASQSDIPMTQTPAAQVEVRTLLRLSQFIPHAPQ